MLARLAVVCGLAFVALLGFFVFPGHTYLQADTQIYVPMLEHLLHPASYPGDLVATKPHLSYTVYDEVTLSLRRAGLSFETALLSQQIITRLLQATGVFLLVSAIGLSTPLSLAASAIAGLGAMIAGPAVLLIEFEPVPRGFAIALVILAIGLAAKGRPVLASAAASLAFVYHAPTTIPFWLCFLPGLVVRRRWQVLIPLAVAGLVIFAAASLQPGVVEKQHFWFRLDPELERLQRLRAPYNWVSTWAGKLGGLYLFYWAAAMVALRRLKTSVVRGFLIGLPLIGLLSVPVSYVFLEQVKWGLISELQPARALLFVTATALILLATAGLQAAELGSRWEAGLALTLAFLIPMGGWQGDWDIRRVGLAVVLAAVVTSAVRSRRLEILAVVLVAAYFLIPGWAHVVTHPVLETADLRGVVDFARNKTPESAMFLFPQAGHGLQPGVVRARAIRSVYVDWKAGGQVNYYRSLADDWRRRWNEVDALVYRPEEWSKFQSLGIDYVVMQGGSAPAGEPAVYRNSTYSVYRVKR